MKEITPRRQKQLDKKDADKELLALYRKQVRLMRARRSTGLVELEKPVRSGYKKFFVLREDVAKGPEAHVYRKLLPYLQNHVYARDKKFLKKDYKTKKMVPIEHHLKAIPHKDWNKLMDDGTLTVKQKSMFMQVWRQTNPNNPKAGYYEFRFTKEWVFVEKIEPHYKTHALVLDPQLESDLRETSNRIERNNLWPKIDHILGIRNSRGDWYGARDGLIEKYYKDMMYNILQYNDDGE